MQVEPQDTSSLDKELENDQLQSQDYAATILTSISRERHAHDPPNYSLVRQKEPANPKMLMES
jgi:hypothetical protein